MNNQSQQQSEAQQKIVAIIKKFPDFASIVPGHILQDFDGNALDEWAVNTSISEGERDIARFVLGIWHRLNKWKVGRFDLFNVANRMDSRNWQVILEWCKKPFFL